MNDYILFKDINDKYQTLPELLVPVEDEKKDAEKTTEDAKTEESKSDDAKAEEKEPERSTIYYVTDKAQQGQYIKMFKEQGMNAVILDHNIDTSFITQLEQRNEHYQFKRIDADVTDALKSDDAADLTEETNTLSDLDVYKRQTPDWCFLYVIFFGPVVFADWRKKILSFILVKIFHDVSSFPILNIINFNE